MDGHLSAFDIRRPRELSDFRRAAALYRSARRRGITIRRTSDCLIAAVCVREQVRLLHADSDFDHLAKVTDLRVIRPKGGTRWRSPRPYRAGGAGGP